MGPKALQSLQAQGRRSLASLREGFLEPFEAGFWQFLCWFAAHFRSPFGNSQKDMHYSVCKSETRGLMHRPATSFCADNPTTSII